MAIFTKRGEFAPGITEDFDFDQYIFIFLKYFEFREISPSWLRGGWHIAANDAILHLNFKKFKLFGVGTEAH